MCFSPTYLRRVVIFMSAILPMQLSDVADAQDILPIFTSPVDITGFTVSLEAVAPDRGTGQMAPRPIPPDVGGPRLRELSTTPINIVFDTKWNGTTEQRSAGTAPIKLACDRIREMVTANALVESVTPYDVSCDFATSGSVFVEQAEGVLSMSYQLFNNVVRLRVTSPATCHPEHGNVFCPNDARFSIRFVMKLNTVIRTSPTICTLRSEKPKVLLSDVEIESENAVGSIAISILGEAFEFGEQALQNTVSESPIETDGAFAEIRSACSGPLSIMLATFTGLETELKLPGRLVFRAIHPPIAAPSFPNTSQSPSVPSFTRPLIAAPPVVKAGVEFGVRGQFFPPPIDPTRIELLVERDNPSTCRGGLTELEYGPVGATPQIYQIAAGASPSHRCADRPLVTGLQIATQYRFRVRDCDVLTCSPWSVPFEMTTLSGSGTGPVEISLDGATTLGTVDVDDTGSFETTVSLPPGTPEGTHDLSASTGGMSDTTSIEVVAPGAPQAVLMVTASYFGEEGCPMHQTEPNIVADKLFSLFGSGFVPGQVNLFLDSMDGLFIRSVDVGGDGTFCGTFHSPSLEFLGDHSIIAVQEGVPQASLAVKVNRPAPLQ